MKRNLVGEQFGNYTLTRLLGQGGFAEVYLGQHIRLDMHVAVKILHAYLPDNEIVNFQREAQVIAKLVHPHIVRLLDFDVKNGTPFLVLDYAPHGTLRQRHPRGKPIPLSTVITYVAQIADALQYAHDQKLIHRDVKPENMLIGRRDEIVLSDFGIATIVHNTSSMELQTSVGTIPYMAPEQIQAQPRPASDQYALGIVAYEWLSGGKPFEGSYTEILAKHLKGSPPPLQQRIPTLSPDVEQVIQTALAKDPGQRFKTVQAFANALEQASQTRPISPLQQQPTESVFLVQKNQPDKPNEDSPFPKPIKLRVLRPRKPSNLREQEPPWSEFDDDLQPIRGPQSSPFIPRVPRKLPPRSIIRLREPQSLKPAIKVPRNSPSRSIIRLKEPRSFESFPRALRKSPSQPQSQSAAPQSQKHQQSVSPSSGSKPRRIGLTLLIYYFIPISIGLIADAIFHMGAVLTILFIIALILLFIYTQ